MKRSWLIVTFLLVGVVMLVYPWIDRSIQEHKQNLLLAEWDHYTDSDAIDSTVADSSSDFSADAWNDEIKPETKSNELVHGLTLLGALTIPAIDVIQPIVLDSTEKSLKYGVGTVVRGTEAGEYGNFVLAGHRGRKYGRLLNRLNELKEGDEILVESSEKNARYYVTETFLVKPDELWVLEQDDSIRELTLITCHPVKNPTHRLIIKAEMEQEMEKAI